MVRLSGLVAFGSLCVAAASFGSGAAPVTGVWQGKLSVRGAEERIVLRVDGATATLDSPDTGKLGIPLQSVEAGDHALAFDLSEPKVVFHGKLSADGSAMTGTWAEDGQDLAVTLVRLAQAPDFHRDGTYLFQSHCSYCHAPFNATRAPWPSTLRLMPQATILAAIETGKMQMQAADLSHEQRVALAAYLGVAEKSLEPGRADACGTDASPMANTPLWNGWSVDLANSRFQPGDAAGLSKDEISRLRVKWAFGYVGATSGGGPPTVVGDRIFVAGGDGRIDSLSARTGCVIWSYLPASQARTAITISPDGKTAYFGDIQGRAYALDAGTGALLWSTDLDHHPFAMVTGAPRLYEGRLYVPVSSAEELAGANSKYPCCTFRGSIAALNAKTGAIVWQTYTIATKARPGATNAAGTQMFGPSGAGIWSSPTIDPDRHVLYTGTGDNYSDPGTAASDAVLAIDLSSGKILWTHQLTADDRFNIGCVAEDKASCPPNPGGDFDIGAPPILRTLGNGKRLLIVGQKSGVVYALDPDDQGRMVWSTRLGKGGPLGGIEFGAAADARTVYVPLSDWSLDPKSGGGLFALDVASGKKIWSAAAPAPACLATPGCSASDQAPATLIPGVVFAASLDGHIRAYDSADGRLLWDFDTSRPFQTVNGVAAHGGSINYAGPVVAGGMVYVVSGYSINAGMPGNVLLAFSVDGK
ncbi:MAG TPA: PQQ-binding-like beta-propeller repeat protein [Acidobacteriaceae bacterium]|jgi:polyvinyl alcohol dehydrogenase (cytochrome)|nr:PQQ-binding-like beta-propeller repeat protein [Acidobacteriaceae bacterium]